MKKQIIGRVFIIGCARSGTTLLQSILSTHPAILSFPETQYFPIVWGDVNERMYGRKNNVKGLIRSAIITLRNRMNVVSTRPEKQSHVIRSLVDQANGLSEMYSAYHRGITIKGNVRYFVKCLDALALNTGAQYWIEKTPNNVYYIKEIEKIVPDAKFIHIIRRGEDVVASIYDAAKRFDRGHDFSKDVDKCIVRWNSATEISKFHLRRTNHKIISYKSLADDTHGTIQKLTKFIGVDYREEMVSEHETGAGKIVRQGEGWKSSVSGEIKNRGNTKFMRLFNQKQREHISEHLNSIDWVDL